MAYLNPDFLASSILRRRLRYWENAKALTTTVVERRMVETMIQQCEDVVERRDLTELKFS